MCIIGVAILFDKDFFYPVSPEREQKGSVKIITIVNIFYINVSGFIA